jgi:hypothetical protein
MKTPFHFLIDIPEAGLALAWTGGGLRRSKTAGKVWLTKPSGEAVLEAPLCQVHPITREQLANTIIAERVATTAPLN